MVGNQPHQCDNGRRVWNCNGRGGLENDSVCGWGGWNEAHQWDYGRRGGNCIGRGGLEGDFACRVRGQWKKRFLQFWGDTGASCYAYNLKAYCCGGDEAHQWDYGRWYNFLRVDVNFFS